MSVVTIKLDELFANRVNGALSLVPGYKSYNVLLDIDIPSKLLDQKGEKMEGPDV